MNNNKKGLPITVKHPSTAMRGEIIMTKKAKKIEKKNVGVGMTKPKKK